MNHIKSEIGECVSVLKRKVWGKTVVNGKLKSQSWWERRLKELIESPTVIIDPKDQPPTSGFPDVPVPFEIEVGIPDLNYEMLLKAWKNTFEMPVSTATPKRKKSST